MPKILNSSNPCKGRHSWNKKIYQELEIDDKKKKIWWEQICTECSSVRITGESIVPNNTPRPGEGNEFFFWLKIFLIGISITFTIAYFI